MNRRAAIAPTALRGPGYENDLEEYELNQLANDREHEPPVDDETPLGNAIEESELLDE